MKYVIEIEDVPFGRNDDPVIPHGMDELYRAKGFKSLVFDRNGLDKLTPYTEPDKNVKNNDVHLCNSCVYNFPGCIALEEDILYGDSENFDNICCCPHYIPKNYYNPESKERKDIEDEVWEFVDKLLFTKYDDIRDCFGSDSSFIQILNKSSYQEAKAKYETWKKQKEAIHVGDEVIPMDTKYNTMIVTRTWKDVYCSDCVDTIGFGGSICSFLTSKVKKTGRHFDEVEELLKKISEAQHNEEE